MAKDFRKWLERFEHFLAAKEVASWVPQSWRGWLVSGALGLLTALIAWAKHRPMEWWIPIAVGVALAALILAHLAVAFWESIKSLHKPEDHGSNLAVPQATARLATLKPSALAPVADLEPEDDQIDFTVWDRRTVFTIRQAAQLWAGKRPTAASDKLTNKAESIQGELCAAGNSGQLKIEPPVVPKTEFGRALYLIPAAEAALNAALGITTFHYSNVTRESLLAFAIERHERPLFLFPEDRGFGYAGSPTLSFDPSGRVRQLYNYDLHKITVANNSPAPIAGCQLRASIKFPDGSEHRRSELEHVSEPFDLAMGEVVEKPFIRIPAGQYGNAAELITVKLERGAWHQEELATFRLSPGTYEIRIYAYSKSAPAAQILLNLSHVNGEWSIVWMT